MTNIIIDTNDFNKKLFESLDEDEENADNSCLISGELLDDEPIILACGHKFNYKAIYYEFVNQKVHSKLEICHLKKYQVKCPYCRNIQTGILPPKADYPKYDGVNWPASKVAKNNRCKVILKSGKNKGNVCGRACSGKYCTMHIRNSIASVSCITCNAIIKTGKRKGQVCNARCKTGQLKESKLCGRHFRNKN